ncbi:SecDF P1 head subdomain-containing protein [Amycolatopsis sp. NPDC052450]|uniref:SecDF P1 head subdomain-containing protein n=1 Tax=Amycolatopsis sp. NPDC052450 TaxID=3363937 RepID=UPI0037C9AAF0
MRILRVVVALVLFGLAGCQGGVSGQAEPEGDSFTIKDGSRLRFRPVLAEFPPGQPTGSATDRQSTDPAGQQAAAAALDCSAGPDPLDGRDDPALPLVSCDRVEGTKYLLGPAFLTGADLSRANARLATESGGPIVGLSFTDAGARTWADWTAGNVGKQVAMVLKSRVLTAPMIQSAITGGETQITGKFTMTEARQLARDIAGA